VSLEQKALPPGPAWVSCRHATPDDPRACHECVEQQLRAGVSGALSGAAIVVRHHLGRFGEPVADRLDRSALTILSQRDRDVAITERDVNRAIFTPSRGRPS
jgi:hypothetical protein